jgi:uncharacterized membrane protein
LQKPAVSQVALPKTLCKNSPKTPQKSSSQKSAKNLSQNFNTKTSKYSKNFLILPKLLNLNTNNMKKFEFICKTDLVTGDKVYLTREDGVYVPSSLRLNKDQAYDIFIKLTNQEPMEMFEVLETKTSPNE